MEDTDWGDCIRNLHSPPCTCEEQLEASRYDALSCNAKVVMAANFWVSSHCQDWLRNPRDDEQLTQIKIRKDRNAWYKEVPGAPKVPFLSDDEVKKLRVHLSIFVSSEFQHCGTDHHLKLTSKPRQTLESISKFYYYNSYRDFHPHLIAATAIYLASKVEESPVQPRNIANAIRDIAKSPYGVHDIVDGEYFLMEELKFNLVVFHPYRPMEQYIHDAKIPHVAQTAWHLIDDSYRLDLCLYYPPHIIAIAVVVMAGVYHQVDVDSWFNQLQFKPEHRQQVKEVQEQLLELYEDYSHLEHEEVRHILEKIPPLPSINTQQGQSPVMSPPAVNTPH